MYRSRAKPGWHVIDNKMVHTDSIMEANILSELVRNGFSQKWRRTRRGISFGYARYTPDAELSIDYQGHSVRAIVEFKAFGISEFNPKSRRRMLGASRYYSRAIPLLYVRKTRQWYEILPDARVARILPPKPGLLNISQLSRPRLAALSFTPYGRAYSASPTPFLLSKVADGLELGINLIFGSPRRRSRSYQRRRR